MDDVTKTAIERWLIKASNDLRTAKTMLALEQPTTDTVCFHSQQSSVSKNVLKLF